MNNNGAFYIKELKDINKKIQYLEETMVNNKNIANEIFNKLSISIQENSAYVY